MPFGTSNPVWSKNAQRQIRTLITKSQLPSVATEGRMWRWPHKPKWSTQKTSWLFLLYCRNPSCSYKQSTWRLGPLKTRVRSVLIFRAQEGQDYVLSNLTETLTYFIILVEREKDLFTVFLTLVLRDSTTSRTTVFATSTSRRFNYKGASDA